MKINLPSNGVLGLKVIDMRPPTFQDLRNVENLNQDEELLKYQFVESLLIGNPDMDKITKMDLDYLFIVAAMQVQLNQIGYEYDCKCGQHNKDTFLFGDQDLIVLPKFKLPHKRKVNGVEFTYTLLSAKQHLQACEYALSQDDEFKTAYDNAAATFVFGKSLDQIDEVVKYDIATFLSAFLFQKVMFHGVKLTTKHKCTKCGKEQNIQITPAADLVKMNIETLLDQYSSIMSVAEFDTFLDFTMPEYITFRDKIASKVNDAG